jgi:hypothetical protein
MKFSENERKKLSECVLKNGENLVDFHHNLLKISGYKIDSFDNTNWYHGIGHASDYYYYMLLHFILHGVLFETFATEKREGEEIGFTEKVVLPAFKKIKEKFGYQPLIVRIYPEDQSDEEDFYWWCYPPDVNEYLINYAKDNNLQFKKL